MKKDSRVVTEFVTKISDEDLRFVITRLTEQYSGDLPEVCYFFGRQTDVNSMLQASSDVDEFYYKLDAIKDAAIKEAKKRSTSGGAY